MRFVWFNCVPFLGKGIRKITEGVNVTQKIHPVEVLVPGAEHIVHLMTKNWGDNDSIFQDVIETRGRGEKWNCMDSSLRQFTMSYGLNLHIYDVILQDKSIKYTKDKGHNFSFLLAYIAFSDNQSEIMSKWPHVFLTGYACVVTWKHFLLINTC